MHRSAHAVAVAEEDIFAHADFIAVIKNGRAGQREQQQVQQLDLLAIISEQRSQPAANAEVDARFSIVCVDAIHIVALFISDHFKGQLIVIAQKQGPLAGLRNRGSLFDDVDNWNAILHPHGHEQPRHQREVKSHVALVT